MTGFRRLSLPLVVLAAVSALVPAGVEAKPAAAAPAPARVIPARPVPPMGAVASMPIPAVDASGVRQTVNANLTPAQKTWNLRSAMNVAALNCAGAKYAPILGAYKALLGTHARSLAATNRAVEKEFRDRYGAASYLARRDAYMTKVYNYFALPPARPDFCDAALVVGSELLTVAPGGLDNFAALALPRIEQVFENFFRAFERYKVEVAAWDAQYGSMFGIGQGGYTTPLAPGLRFPNPQRPLPTPSPPVGVTPSGTAPAAPAGSR